MPILAPKGILWICYLVPKLYVLIVWATIISQSNGAGNVLSTMPPPPLPATSTSMYLNVPDASVSPFAMHRRLRLSVGEPPPASAVDDLTRAHSVLPEEIPTTKTSPNPTTSKRKNQLSPNLIGNNDQKLSRGARKKLFGTKENSSNGFEEPEKITLKKFEMKGSTASTLDTWESSFNNNMLEEFYRTPMSFGTENLTMVTTQIGATAFLPCRVHFIGEGVVSWIRRKDYHLLTVALTTYSSDERFSATHLKTAEDWTLQIRYVQARDAGTYECQVSTHPPTSIFVHLNVIEARAEIIGPPLRYLTPDSSLRLICRVVQSTEMVSFLFWYHDDRMINYDYGINITTEADFHYSELTILRAAKRHSGNYSCVPSNSQPASVLVHIFKGDNPAAMHHDHLNGAASSRVLYSATLLALVLILVIARLRFVSTLFVR